MIEIKIIETVIEEEEGIIKRIMVIEMIDRIATIRTTAIETEIIRTTTIETSMRKKPMRTKTEKGIIKARRKLKTNVIIVESNTINYKIIFY